MSPAPVFALTAPSVRMLVVSAFAEPRPGSPGDWLTDVEFIPVVAVAARPDPDGPGVEYGALIVDPDRGVADADAALECCNGAHQLVAAPWPADEDPARLARVVERVTAAAIRSAAAHPRFPAAERAAMRQAAG